MRPKKDTAKALQERYQEVLGLAEKPGPRPAPWRQRLRRPLVLLLVAAVSTGLAWFYLATTRKAEQRLDGSAAHAVQDAENLPLGDAPRAPPTPQESAPTVAASTGSEPGNGLTEPSSPMPATTRPNGAAAVLAPTTDTDDPNAGVAAKDDYLVIVESTKSKEAAVAQARELRQQGYASEVILSTSGFYGVALGRFDLEQANAAVTSLLSSGTAGPKPYVMATDRVLEVIPLE